MSSTEPRAEDATKAEDRVVDLMAALTDSVREAREARASARQARETGHPDPDRMRATVYERAAWEHDCGRHDGSDFPYLYCPRCEMEHPLGRFSVLALAARAVLAEWDVRGDHGCSKTVQDELRKAVVGG